MPDLVKKCIRGDQEAFERLVDQYAGFVIFTIRSVFRDYCRPASSEDVEDLHNGVFLSLMEDDFRPLRQFKGRSSFTTYLRVITYRRTVDFLRTENRHSPISTGDPEGGNPSVIDEQPGQDAELEMRDERKMLAQAISFMSAEDRLLLKLAFARELPAQRVASILNISVNAYYARKNRALGRLKKMCKKFDPEPSIRVRRQANRV